jgi:hypothetical protein
MQVVESVQFKGWKGRARLPMQDERQSRTIIFRTSGVVMIQRDFHEVGGAGADREAIGLGCQG